MSLREEGRSCYSEFPRDKPLRVLLKSSEGKCDVDQVAMIQVPQTTKKITTPFLAVS